MSQRYPEQKDPIVGLHTISLHFVTLLLAGAALLLSQAAAAQTRTMGFTRQFEFPYSAGANLHWLSLPWNYHPADVGTIGQLDAQDLCQDLGGEPAVDAVLRWNEGSSTFAEHLCGAPSPFTLTKGIAYAVRNGVGLAVNGVVAGSHDNSFQYSIAASGGSQLSWLSIPYHVRIPERFGDLRVTAEDICRQVGSAELFAIVRWDEVASVYESYGCGSELQEPFDVERGEGYGFVNRSTQTITWQPVHY